MHESETNPLESEASSSAPASGTAVFPAWIKVGAIAAASALAGGLAAAWFYRKTLNTLRQAESETLNSDFGINPEGIDQDT